MNPRANADEHLVVGGRRCRYLADLHHVRKSIARRDSGPHAGWGYGERGGKFHQHSHDRYLDVVDLGQDIEQAIPFLPALSSDR
jgi:hypothetical protein